MQTSLSQARSSHDEARIKIPQNLLPARLMIPDSLVVGAISADAPLLAPTRILVDSYFSALLRVEQAQKDMDDRLAQDEDHRP